MWGMYGVVVFDQLTRVLGQLSEIHEPWRVLSNYTTGITLFYEMDTYSINFDVRQPVLESRSNIAL